jgi:hypothetical protein
LGVNKSSPTVPLDVTGDINFTGNLLKNSITLYNSSTGQLTVQTCSISPTATAPQILIGSQTILSTPIANTIENDGFNLFYTQSDLTNGHKQAIIPAVQFKRLSANGTAISATTAATAGSWLGTTSGFAMLAGEFYQIEAVLFYTKTTSGTVSLALTSSVGNFTSASLSFTLSGTTAAGGTLNNGTTSPVATTSTVTSVATGVTGMIIAKGLVIPVSNTRVTLGAFNSAGSITPLTNSLVKVTCLSNANVVGNIA